MDSPELETRRTRARHGLSLALAGLVLGVLVVTSIWGRPESQRLDSVSQSDLVVILDGLSGRLARLQAEQLDLIAAKNEIVQGSDKEALARAREQLFAMRVLAGTVQVQGPGIEVQIWSTRSGLGYDTVLALVQELRDAGAEAIEINGKRVGARSAFSQNDRGAILLDGRRLTLPLTVAAIGDSQTLQVALEMPGGVGATITSDGGRMKITSGPVVILSTVRVKS